MNVGCVFDEDYYGISLINENTVEVNDLKYQVEALRHIGTVDEIEVETYARIMDGLKDTLVRLNTEYEPKLMMTNKSEDDFIEFSVMSATGAYYDLKVFYNDESELSLSVDPINKKDIGYLVMSAIKRGELKNEECRNN